jgi:hypothetical protein
MEECVLFVVVAPGYLIIFKNKASSCGASLAIHYYVQVSITSLCNVVNDVTSGG